MTVRASRLDAFEFPEGHAITPVTHEIEAPSALVYELMSAIGQGAQAEHDGATVLSRDGNDLVCEFRTEIGLPIVGRRVLRTREAVRLVPPDAIAFRHLNGPVRGLTERIRVEPIDARRSRVTYDAVLPGTGWMDGLRFALARRSIKRAVAEHFADIAERAEARATRSRVHAPTRAATEG